MLITSICGDLWNLCEIFRRGDEHITLDYFYGYCREAYRFLDSRYQLRRKDGLDFMTLAHTYYQHDRKAQEILRLALIYGYKGKEISRQWGMTPATVSQRLKKMMDEVVRPYFLNYYVDHQTVGAAPVEAMPLEAMTLADMDYSCSETAPQSPSIMQQTNPSRITPEFITTLQPGEIFVFGSNLQGYHAGGAAHIAEQRFGAVWGQGVGPQGQSYAIPTMQGQVDTIRPYVDQFTAYAAQHPEQRFLVTRIGCGIAGFAPADIAPLFQQAAALTNVTLPADFWEEL